MIHTKILDIEFNGFHRNEFKSIHIWIYRWGVHIFLSRGVRGIEFDKLKKEELDDWSKDNA